MKQISLSKHFMETIDSGFKSRIFVLPKRFGRIE